MNSVYAKETRLIITNSVFTDNQPYIMNNTSFYEFPSGLYLEEIPSLTIMSTSFTNLKGKDGGAIYLSLSETFKRIWNQQLHYELIGLTIQNCFSTTNGGGIYLNNIKDMKLYNSKITNNLALEKGGGIYF